MALSDRAAAVAPYAQQLLYDEEVQHALRRAVGSTRVAYARTRGKSAREAAKDKKLWRGLQQAVGAAWEVWSAVDEPPRRKPRRHLELVALFMGGRRGVLGAQCAGSRESP